MIVSKIMIKKPLTLPKGERLQNVISKMAEESSSYALAMDGKVPVGIISERDVTRFITTSVDM